MVEYFVTDVSFALASGAASVCSHPHIIPKAYDLSKPLDEQGFTPGSVDIVTAFHVLHATPDISSTLTSLYELLAPGGCLLVIELDGDAWGEVASLEKGAGSLWCDFVFGCFAEWYGSTDGRDHCTMSPKQWNSALESANFSNIQFAVDPVVGSGVIFSAQKPRRIPLTAPSYRPGASFFTFKYGEETRLQQWLYELDVNMPLTVWLLCSEGIDGDVAAGMTPTLAKEFSHWTIHAAVFSSATYEESGRIQAVLRNWDCCVDEQVLHFDKAGEVSVAKVVPLRTPTAVPAVLDSNGAWFSDGFTVKQCAIQPLEDDEVTIDILAWSQQQCGSWRGFVGSVIESRIAGIVTGNHFLGIANGTRISNRINCNVDMLARIDELDASLAEDALSMVVAASALGPARLASPRHRTFPLHVFFSEQTKFNRLTARLFSHPSIGAQVTFETPPADVQLSLIIMDSAAASAHSELESWLIPETGELFIWDEFLDQESKKHPWNLGYALNAALKLRGSPDSTNYDLVYSLEVVKTFHVAIPELPLFDGDKSYIIIGGASDIGVHMSLWMYQVSIITRFCAFC